METRRASLVGSGALLAILVARCSPQAGDNFEFSLGDASCSIDAEVALVQVPVRATGDGAINRIELERLDGAAAIGMAINQEPLPAVSDLTDRQRRHLEAHPHGSDLELRRDETAILAILIERDRYAESTSFSGLAVEWGGGEPLYVQSVPLSVELNEACAVAESATPAEPQLRDLSADEIVEELARLIPVDGPPTDPIPEAGQFGNIRFEGKEVVLLWDGTPPESVMGILARADHATTTRVEQAPHTHEEMIEAMNALSAEVKARKIAGVRLNLWGPSPDNTHIFVGYYPKDEVSREEVEAAVEEIVGMPAQAEPSGGIIAQ